MKKATLLQKILLSLIIAMPVILLADLALRYFFDITLTYGMVVISWAIVALPSLYVFFPIKKLFVFVCCAIVVSLGIIFYNFKRDAVTGWRSALNGSPYVIDITMRNYTIIKDYGFAEKIVATKHTDFFFDANSKTGVNYSYKAKFLKETPDSIYIRIYSGMPQTQSLKKTGFWEKN